jgi:hypothetical protein
MVDELVVLFAKVSNLVWKLVPVGLAIKFLVSQFV